MSGSMNEETKSAIENTINDVFERMFFMFPSAVSGADLQLCETSPCFSARVSIDKCPVDVLCFGAINLVERMAGNFLGTQGDVDLSSIVDVFKEASNVVAGNFIQALDMGADAALGIPVVEKLASSVEAKALPGIVFDVDGDFFKVCLVNSST